MANAGKIVLFIVEFVFWMASILVGARLGGICIGFVGALGVGVLVYGFQEPVGSIPFDVLKIMMAVVCATATLQVAGGMDALVLFCERLLRKHPQWITIVAPLVTLVMTILSGTGYVFLSLMPVVAEVARSSGVRPSKPLSVSVLASMYGVLASPISAAVVYMSDMYKSFDRDVTYGHVLITMLPAVLVGSLMTSLCTMKLGSDKWDAPSSHESIELEDLESQQGVCPSVDPHTPPTADEQLIMVAKAVYPKSSSVETLTPLTTDEFNNTAISEPKDTPVKPPVGNLSFEDASHYRSSVVDSGSTKPASNLPRGAKRSVVIFVMSILVAICLAILSSTLDGLKADPGDGIVICMMGGAAITVWVCKVRAVDIPRTPVFASGMTAAMCIFGVAWMGGTFMMAHMEDINSVTGGVLSEQPWLLMIMVWLLASLLFGQAATARALFPPAMELGMSSYGALCAFPCVATLWLLSSAPAIICAAQMDTTKTFRLGKYLIDHSCAIPGLIFSFTTIAVTAGIGAALIGTD